MTVFKKVLNGLHLDHESQGTGNHRSFLYVLLAECDRFETLNPTADVFANPYSEVLRRLGAYSNTFAYQDLAKEIGARAN